MFGLGRVVSLCPLLSIGMSVGSTQAGVKPVNTGVVIGNKLGMYDSQIFELNQLAP